MHGVSHPEGYRIEADRIDKLDMQELRVRVYACNILAHEDRLLYTIKYDYYRGVGVEYGKTIWDFLHNRGIYGCRQYKEHTPPEKKATVHVLTSL